jgi:glutamate synthase (NADPH/NADH)
MVPEAWQNDKLMSQEKKDFYRWAACAMVREQKSFHF